jgi:predicted phosphodiesterase
LPAEIEQIYLLGISDLHVGAPEHNAAYTEKLLRWVLDTPNAFLILNGDLANCALKNSKSDVYEETMSPNEQRKYLLKLLTPIKGRVLGVTEGNHEMRIRKDTSIDICQDIAEALECPYGREGLLLQIRLGKGKNGKPVSYLVYATHGWSSARSAGGKVNMTTSLATVVYADVYITGHTHSKFVFEKDFYLPDEQNQQVRLCKQVFASSGSVLDYGGYAQAKGYPPGAKGIPRVILDGRRKDIHASI